MNSKIRTFFMIVFISFIILNTSWLFLGHDKSLLSTTAVADSFVDKLSDGSSDITVQFNPNGGSNTEAKLKFPKGADVLSASFNVTGLPDGLGNYPTEVKLDVGDDGDLEWEFNISSVGSFGRQTNFIGSIDNKRLVLDKGESDESLLIRLPRDANILSADLNVEGYSHGIPNGDFETGTMVGWNTITNQYSDTVSVQNGRGGDDPPGSWGATGYYLMLRSNPFGSYDDDCNIVVESDLFPKFDTDYITMDWDMLENDRFSLDIQVQDDNSNSVTARFIGGNGDDDNNNAESLTKQVIDISSLTGNNLKIYLHLEDGSFSWWDTRNDWGRIAVDNLYISDDIGDPLPNYPTDFGIDVGSDGSKEFTKATLNGLESVTGIKTALNDLLTTPSPACQITKDKYGNEFVDIPLNISVLSSPGLINISDLEITYEYKAHVFKNPRGTLVDELNDLIPSSGSGDATITIALSSTTGGKIKISDIHIKYNAKPSSQTIPMQNIVEDSVNPKILDLSTYFSDDSDPLPLNFEIAENSAPDKLEAIIEDGHYLTLNANQKEDWYGNVNLVIRATDNHGSIVESNKFTVQVRAMNDEPIANVPLTKFTMWEDGSGITVALNDVPYFTDIENDDLFYSVIVDPTGQIPGLGDNLSVYLTENNELFIISKPNWFSTNIPVFLYCDDDDSPIDIGSGAPHQQFLVDVISVNDAPELEGFDTIYLDEDAKADDYLDLTKKASDIETPSNKLEFEILSNDNDKNILVEVDSENNLDITITTLDYVGFAKIKLQVMDEDGATDEESFKIIINSKNDGPKLIEAINEIEMLEDTIDSTSMNLFDVFYDPDSPITFEYIGNQYITVTISEETGAVTFKPDKNWFGTENIEFTAVDTFVETGSSKQTNSLSVEVTVLPVNDPPNTPKIISPQMPRADPTDRSVTFTSEPATDVDDEDLYYYWDFDNRVDNNGDGDPTNDMDGIGLEMQYNNSASGYYYVTLYVSDGELNCSPPASIYVKVMPDEAYNEKVTINYTPKGTSTTANMDVMLWIPFIILIIILILGIVVIKRKDKREPEADVDPRTGMGRHRSKPEKPQVYDGELVSEPKLPPDAKVMIVPAKPAKSTKPAKTAEGSSRAGSESTTARPAVTKAAPAAQTVIHKPSASPAKPTPQASAPSPAPKPAPAQAPKQN